MRVLPRSLTGRLLVTAACALILGIAVSAVVIAGVLERFVTHALDTRLDTEIVLLARVLDRDPPDIAMALHTNDLPPFDGADPEETGSRWIWMVEGPFGVIRSASSGGRGAMPELPRQTPPPPPHAPPLPELEILAGSHVHVALHGDLARIRPMDARDGADRTLHSRVASFGHGPRAITIAAAAPYAIVEQPLRAAIRPLVESVTVMIVVMLAALAAQIRIGLRPVARLRTMVAEIGAGRLRRIAIEEPTELVPLVEELDALLVANDRAVAQARTHVSNLAHGLKTPLAALKLDLVRDSGHGAAHFVLLVERMERQIRHHLGRARAAAGGSVASPSIFVRPHVDDVVDAVSRIHAETPRRVALDIPVDLAIRCDRQDFDELLGNLLDNAWRHAASEIRVSAAPDGALAIIAIEDDGRGLSDGEIAMAMREGRRIDEQAVGWGFGLGISRELCELHGGALALGRSQSGGLSARVMLRSV